ncbi:MAG TPA: carboxypeptidase regulatory-like domain-containing protein, partial [Pyrinomonadaceae bacterium]
MLLLLLSAASLCQAQTGSATLRVSVADPNKAVVPKAAVTITSERTGEQRRAESNDDGDATFPSLDPGVYTVRVEVTNFKTAEQRGVTLSPNSTRGVDIQLEIGVSTEVVTVVSNVPEIQTETGAKENTITAQQIDNLSIVSRSSLELLRILPGVVAPSPDDPGFQSTSFNSGANANNNYNVNGLRGVNNSVSIDGSRVIDIGSNNGTIITANPDMVSEVKVQTSNYAAEHGTSGVQITATTKGGGQDFHGTIYDYVRHHKLNANDRSRSSFNIERAPEKYYYPGGNIGGPVCLPRFGEGGSVGKCYKDKLFFFFAFEVQRQTVDPGTSLARVPTLEQRQGRGFFNRNSGNAPFNLDPALISPIGRALINLYPEPNFTESNCTGPNCRNYAFSGLQPVNRTQANLRFDYKVNDKVSAYLRLARESEEQDYARGLWWSPSAYELPSHVRGTNLGRSAALGITTVINPTMTNEIVLSASKLQLNNDYQDPDKVSLNSLGLSNLRGPFGQISQYAPIALITSWSGQTTGDLWEPGNLPLFAHNSSYSVYDNL